MLIVNESTCLLQLYITGCQGKDAYCAFKYIFHGMNRCQVSLCLRMMSHFSWPSVVRHSALQISKVYPVKKILSNCYRGPLCGSWKVRFLFKIKRVIVFYLFLIYSVEFHGSSCFSWQKMTKIFYFYFCKLFLISPNNNK